MDKANIWNTLILAGCYLVLFALGELLYRVFKVKAEITRKLIHVGTGLLALLFPVLLDSHWLVLILCSAFALILISSLRFGWLPSINAIDRKSVGSLAYPVAVYGCYLAFQFNGYDYTYYYLPILVLAICDPLAALAGKRWPIGRYTLLGARKTLFGSAMFFVGTLVLVSLYLSYMTSAYVLWQAVMSIALLATLAEAASKDGYDNISIPLSVVVGLLFSKYLWI